MSNVLITVRSHDGDEIVVESDAGLATLLMNGAAKGHSGGVVIGDASGPGATIKFADVKSVDIALLPTE